MGDAELADLADRTTVFAKLTPAQKERIVQALRRKGHVVGFLGDGINDSPALKVADVGISVDSAVDIAKGSANIVIGTHALLGTAVTFATLGLVVIDEQHKFGVAQRAALVRKAQAADVLVMTATPIPRTLALSIYGDVACSTIEELPPGRLPVTTRWCQEDQRADVYRLIRDELGKGRQAYVVYPLVEAQEQSQIKAASRSSHRSGKWIWRIAQSKAGSWLRTRSASGSSSTSAWPACSRIAHITRRSHR